MHAPLVAKSLGMVLCSAPQVTGSRWQMEPETWSGFLSAINAPKPQHVTDHASSGKPWSWSVCQPGLCREAGHLCAVSLLSTARLPTYRSPLRRLPLRVLNE